MKTRLVKVGNSRGIRIPRQLLELCRIAEGDNLELQPVREGILIRRTERSTEKLEWPEAYAQMAAEPSEADEWDLWDGVTGDGLDD